MINRVRIVYEWNREKLETKDKEETERTIKVKNTIYRSTYVTHSEITVQLQ